MRGQSWTDGLVRNSGWPTVLIAFVSCLGIACGGGGDSPTRPTETPSQITTTFLSYVSSPGDYIGQGQTRRYTLTDGSWRANIDPYGRGPNHISVAFDGATSWWRLELGAPAAKKLAVGTYENATRWPFQEWTAPGLDFAADGRGCNTSTGRFVIKELKLGAGTNIDRLHVTFEQHCREASSPPLIGELAIVANPWR